MGIEFVHLQKYCYIFKYLNNENLRWGKSGESLFLDEIRVFHFCSLNDTGFFLRILTPHFIALPAASKNYSPPYSIQRSKEPRKFSKYTGYLSGFIDLFKLLKQLHSIELIIAIVGDEYRHGLTTSGFFQSKHD
jgi:hypothetical protein